MTRRNWRSVNPTSLGQAIKLCVEYAQEKHRRSVDRIADLMGTSPFTVYGWLRDESVPGRKIEAFQHACGCDFITRFHAHSAGCLLIPIPPGRLTEVDDVHRLQATCNAAVTALVGFASGHLDADKVGGDLTKAMEALAWYRENAQRSHQPELELNNHE